MRVQVAVEEGEERKLGDRLHVAGGGDDAARKPVPFPRSGKRRPRQAFGEAVQCPHPASQESRALRHAVRRAHALERPPQHLDRAEVAEQEGEAGGGEASNQ